MSIPAKLPQSQADAIQKAAVSQPKSILKKEGQATNPLRRNVSVGLPKSEQDSEKLSFFQKIARFFGADKWEPSKVYFEVPYEEEKREIIVLSRHAAEPYTESELRSKKLESTEAQSHTKSTSSIFQSEAAFIKEVHERQTAFPADVGALVRAAELNLGYRMQFFEDQKDVEKLFTKPSEEDFKNRESNFEKGVLFYLGIITVKTKDETGREVEEKKPSLMQCKKEGERFSHTRITEENYDDIVPEFMLPLQEEPEEIFPPEEEKIEQAPSKQSQVQQPPEPAPLPVVTPKQQQSRPVQLGVQSKGPSPQAPLKPPITTQSQQVQTVFSSVLKQPLPIPPRPQTKPSFTPAPTPKSQASSVLPSAQKKPPPPLPKSPQRIGTIQQPQAPKPPPRPPRPEASFPPKTPSLPTSKPPQSTQKPPEVPPRSGSSPRKK